MSSPQLESAFTKANYPIPVSNGIFDHREKVGSAIWLFLLLVDWTTLEQDGVGQVLGGKPITTTKLKEALRLEERQVRAQLQRLQSIGFIRLRRTSYGFVIEVLKSKKFIFRDRQKVAALPLLDWQETSDQNPQIGNNSPLRSAINCRNKEDYTEETKKKRVRDKPSPDPISFTNSKRKLTRRQDPATVEAFGQFYQAYPRHAAKQKALEAWLKLAPDTDLVGAIMAAVERYAAEVKDTESKFILHPATWLNGRRWEDEIAAGNGKTDPPKIARADEKVFYLEDGSFMPKDTYRRRYPGAKI